jgi:hypothetical protein
MVLEDTTIKLGDVATDMPLQVSTGDARPPCLAGKPTPRSSPSWRGDACVQSVRSWSRRWWGSSSRTIAFYSTSLLAQIDSLEEAITRVSNEIATHMHAQEPVEHDQPEQEVTSAAPAGQPNPRSPLTWALAIALLCTIPGIGRRSAEGILAEIGLNMGRFPTAAHLASWAGMCPGNQ